MKKKIYAVCALVLVAAMFFSFAACDAGTVGRKEIVKYQADYVFWKAA